MNMTAEKRATAYVRRLRVGDVFVEGTEAFEVARKPEVIDEEEVQVYLKSLPVSKNSRARGFVYPKNARVKLA